MNLLYASWAFPFSVPLKVDLYLTTTLPTLTTPCPCGIMLAKALREGLSFVMAEYPCVVPGCDRVFKTEQQRKGHLLTHVSAETLINLLKGNQQAPEQIIKELGGKGDTMTTDSDKLEEAIRHKIEKERQEKEAQVTLAESIKGISGRLDEVDTKLGKIDADFCSQFPALCAKVEAMEKTMTQPTVDYGSEKWKERRRKDVEHILLDDCPECGPMRQDVLTKAGKQIVNLEAKVDKVEETLKTETSQPQPASEELEAETSPGYREGFKWDEERSLYVKR